MSTPITLSVGDITLTYNTMHIGMDHGMLFQESDRKRLRRPTINYEYYEEHPELDLAGHEECFCRTLQSVVSRLELLGFNLDTARVEYERSVETDLENREELTAAAETLTTGDVELLDPSKRPAAMSFDEFLEFIRAHAVNDLSNEFNSDLSEEGRRAVRGRFVDDPDANRLPREEFYNDIDGYSERGYFGGLIGFLSAYATLRVLAENPANLNLEVVWDHGAFVHAGWARMEQFIPGTHPCIDSLTLRAVSPGMQGAEVSLSIQAAPVRPAVAAAEPLTELSYWRFSPASAQRPDPNVVLADSDMNSWTWGEVPMKQAPDALSWRMYRTDLRLRADLNDGRARLVFRDLAGKAEVWLAGVKLGEKTSDAPADFSVVPPVGAKQRQLTVLIESQPTHASGIRGRVTVQRGDT